MAPNFDQGCCNAEEHGWDEVFFNRNMEKDDVWSGFDPFQDETNGMFIKALKHNRSHNIFRMNYCCCAFGYKTERMIKALLKPRPTEEEEDDDDEQEKSSKRRKR
jgi:predicted adenine nucleotide alpha hydrolase (AANH) superfamily ATPase